MRLVPGEGSQISFKIFVGRCCPQGVVARMSPLLAACPKEEPEKCFAMTALKTLMEKGHLDEHLLPSASSMPSPMPVKARS